MGCGSSTVSLASLDVAHTRESVDATARQYIVKRDFDHILEWLMFNSASQRWWILHRLTAQASDGFVCEMFTDPTFASYRQDILDATLAGSKYDLFLILVELHIDRIKVRPEYGPHMSYTLRRELSLPLTPIANRAEAALLPHLLSLGLNVEFLTGEQMLQMFNGWTSAWVYCFLPGAVQDQLPRGLEGRFVQVGTDIVLDLTEAMGGNLAQYMWTFCLPN